MLAQKRFRVLAGILIFFAFLAVVTKIVDPDFYWHLRDGESILATHTVPRIDLYSYSMANMPWVDHEWLVEAFMAWMWNHGLMRVLDVMFAVVAFVPFAVWLRRYRTWPDLWVIAPAAALFMSFIAVKPQVLSYLFFFIVFELLSRYYVSEKERGARRRIYLAVLPLIFFVWANIHAEFFSGLVLFAVFLFTDVAVEWWRTKKIRAKEILFSVGTLFASILTPLLNPYGIGLYGEIFRVMLSGNTMRYIQEWQSPLLTPLTFSPAIIAVSVTLAAFILIVISNYKKMPPTQLAAGILFFALYLKAQRMGPLFIIAAIPLMHDGLVHIGANLSLRWHLVKRQAKPFFIGLFVALSVAALALVLAAPVTLAAIQYPAGAVAFLNQHEAQGEHIVILNYYGWGGYLIWNAPEIKVFIDGRMPHWIASDGVSAMEDYIAVFLSPKSTVAAQESILKKWGINTVLIPTSYIMPGNKNGTLGANLLSAGWITTYSDPIATVLQCEQASCK